MAEGPTLSKTDPDVNYRAAPPKAKERCGTCDMYSNHKCTLVRGLIMPFAVCNKYEPKAGASRAA